MYPNRLFIKGSDELPLSSKSLISVTCFIATIYFRDWKQVIQKMSHLRKLRLELEDQQWSSREIRLLCPELKELYVNGHCIFSDASEPRGMSKVTAL